MLHSSIHRAMLGCGVLALCAISARAVVETTPATQPTVPAREARRVNPIPADEGSRITGKRIYGGSCAPCHGENGKGHGTVAHLLELPPSDLTAAKYAQQTDGTLFWKISNGHKPMPKFENNLPVESRWNVVNHLRTLTVIPAIAPAASPATEPATQPK